MRPALVLSLVVVATAASAQTAGQAPPDPMGGMDMGQAAASVPEQSSSMPDMPGMDMAGMASTGLLGPYPRTRDSSGTSWQPDDAAHQGLMTTAGDWMLMGHVMLWGIYDSQSGPRGGDKLYPAGMIMGMARRDLDANDTLDVRVMLSPDPLMGNSGYPLLLAAGETANGRTPLIDRQHPHDLLMELAGSYSHARSADDSVFVYAGDPGEPALGPPAFMHRPSSVDDPAAPITHHWLDSTHITFGVITAGFVHDDFKLEFSEFNGREPDENRYDFDPARLDSSAVRASWNPDAHWAFQASWGYLKSPEQLEPLVNENRFTASAMYVTPLGTDSSLAATIAWGLKDESIGAKLNGVLGEAEYKIGDAWTAFTRLEWEENSELAQPEENGQLTPPAVSRVGEFTLGGIHDWRVSDAWKFGLGALYTFDFAPSSLGYGSDPHGTMVFARVVAE